MRTVPARISAFTSSHFPAPTTATRAMWSAYFERNRISSQRAFHSAPFIAERSARIPSARLPRSLIANSSCGRKASTSDTVTFPATLKPKALSPLSLSRSIIVRLVLSRAGRSRGGVSISRRRCERGLAAFGSVEDDPDDEVIGEVLESMLGVRGHEEDVAGSERPDPGPVAEVPLSLDHDVHLVARVRLLRVGSAGRVDLDVERAVLEHRRPSLPRRSRQPRERLLDADLALHDRLLSMFSFALRHARHRLTLLRGTSPPCGESDE